MSKKLPCITCPVRAICISKSHIQCSDLLDWAAYYNYDVYPIKEMPNLTFLETGGQPLTGCELKVKGVQF